MAKIKTEKKTPFVITKIAYYFSIRLAVFLSRYSITPNQITYASFISALAAFACFTVGNIQLNIAGMLLFSLSYLLDAVDGDLARVKKQTSQFGTLADAVLGKIGCVLLFMGICIGQSKHYPPGNIWFLGFLAISGYYVSQSLIHKLTIVSMKSKMNSSKDLSSQKVDTKNAGNRVNIVRKFAREVFIGGDFILYVLIVAVLLDKMMFFLVFSAIYMWLDHMLQLYFNFKKFRFLNRAHVNG
ncbi:CDP-alcohol phosphatidyltransferase family protein [Omnitrophica bacterium]|nr:CDP-alcohol phosphatidyltransferase family protein [Candidatus Omnitrophota bacterium]